MDCQVHRIYYSLYGQSHLGALLSATITTQDRATGWMEFFQGAGSHAVYLGSLSSILKLYNLPSSSSSQRVGLNSIPVTNALDIPIGTLVTKIPWVAMCDVLMFCWASFHTVTERHTSAMLYGLASAAAISVFAGTIPSLTKGLEKIGTWVDILLSMMMAGALIHGR
ncbi:uncharacterized protein N7500_010525 [Penicillium coprophilum]|uniref:uncharacterized protein n=1 Tax=Penicillium coprophilum TaxID=36646 RepID=UPI002397C5F3|nr:uncharacterized protein N7500_010525 [Penicillium coprophilum]KAJ5155086.1 hypothetical protein N7500_010525 [Penicillium coprophilum]